MSRRSAPNPRPLAPAALMTVAAAVALALGPTGPAPAQDAPRPPTKLEDRAKGTDPAPPLPADGPRKRPPAAFALDTDRLMFTKIEDFKRVASQQENADEYAAWVEVVLHAKQFATADLEAAAARDLIPLDLIKPVRTALRGELVRFDGKLVCARRLPAPQFFRDNPESGVTEMYEVRLVPLDESPLTPVSVAFLELPEALARVRTAAPGEWADADGWVTAAGYYFKTMGVPGDDGRPLLVPVLIAKGVTPRAGPPVPPGPDPTAIDPHVRAFKFIKDETFMTRAAPSDATWPELAAYNRVLLHASRFPAEELERYARTDVTFADLFGDARLDLRLKAVRFEGRLISLRRTDANPELRAAGVAHVFEGWLVPKDEPRGNPVCVTFTEPLEGVEPVGRVDRWVTFAGYSFKKMRYESMEPDPKNPKKNLDKYAPLLVGKRPVVRPDPRDYTAPATWSAFVQWVVGGLVVMVGGAAALTWWYRGGDRAARRQIDAVRGKNPFDGAAP